MAANGVCKITCEAVKNWLRYQQKTLRRRCNNVGSVLCIKNFWSSQIYRAVAVVPADGACKITW